MLLAPAPLLLGAPLSASRVSGQHLLHLPVNAQLLEQRARLFEAVAALMDLDEGQTRLELVFDGGHLRRWYSHSERHGADELARYDERASWLIVR